MSVHSTTNGPIAVRSNSDPTITRERLLSIISEVLDILSEEEEEEDMSTPSATQDSLTNLPGSGQ